VNADVGRPGHQSGGDGLCPHAHRIDEPRRLVGGRYYGSASTQFARLNTDGTGFIASLEGGDPFALPQLGPGFVLEPQGQILWQKVCFRHDYDGLGDVALADTTGPSGRVGLRGKWTIVTGGDQVWQPYLRANVWRDWGADANTVYSGTDGMAAICAKPTLGRSDFFLGYTPVTASSLHSCSGLSAPIRVSSRSAQTSVSCTSVYLSERS
jgi:hypothetical protein